MIRPAYLRTAHAGLLYDAELRTEPGADWFDLEAWRAQNALVGQAVAGRGAVWFVDSAHGVWAVRHYQRGGLVARLITDQYLWLGEARTRCFREWLLLADLHALGLPVPAPVAARYERSGPFYRADLITAFIADAPSFESLFLDERLSADIWFAAGRLIRRFHDAGVDHADLNIRNMLVRPDGEIFLIDFDKGRRRPPGSWGAQNVARLERSIRKVCLQTGAHFDAVGWQRLIDGYTSSAAGAP